MTSVIHHFRSAHTKHLNSSLLIVFIIATVTACGQIAKNSPQLTVQDAKKQLQFALSNSTLHNVPDLKQDIIKDNTMAVQIAEPILVGIYGKENNGVKMTCINSLFQKNPPTIQNIIINGKILDKETNAPIIFLNLYLQKNHLGTSTDTAGEFVLKIPQDRALCFPDTLVLNYVGYDALKIPIDSHSTLIRLSESQNVYYLIPSKKPVECGPPPMPVRRREIFAPISDKDLRKTKRSRKKSNQ